MDGDLARFLYCHWHDRATAWRSYLFSSISKVSFICLYFAFTMLTFHCPTSGLRGLMNLGGDLASTWHCPPKCGIADGDLDNLFTSGLPAYNHPPSRRLAVSFVVPELTNNNIRLISCFGCIWPK
jgi:hypothetical protein